MFAKVFWANKTALEDENGMHFLFFVEISEKLSYCVLSADYFAVTWKSFECKIQYDKDSKWNCTWGKKSIENAWIEAHIFTLPCIILESLD